MKNIFKILFVVALIFSSCDKKFSPAEFEFDELEIEEINPDVVGKKGTGKTTGPVDWVDRVVALKPHWHYGWSSDKHELAPDNIEFVPMQWGKWNLDEKIAIYKRLKAEGDAFYLLGFNEPDSPNQANMTVDQAIELWPRLEEVGLPLGSPVAVNARGDWMKEFMQKAEEEDLRVDFVAVHWYGGATASTLINNLYEIYDLYGKPIWITEFAPADWPAETPEDNKFSDEQVLKFMKDVLPQLEALEFVHRYAWYSFQRTAPMGTSSALYEDDGTLTPLGEFYADFSPNDDIGSSK